MHRITNDKIHLYSESSKKKKKKKLKKVIYSAVIGRGALIGRCHSAVR